MRALRCLTIRTERDRDAKDLTVPEHSAALRNLLALFRRELPAHIGVHLYDGEYAERPKDLEEREPTHMV
jgi:hypothetical protein